MSRGYVTAYAADTGAKLWRFYTVPGNPARGFEDPAMRMAAKTWSGQWWRFGGGGDVWNAMAYDPETDTLFIGTGSGYPWNRRVRSEDKGDNLFVASIVALDGRNGHYKWHYQVVPGDTWDFDATMDIELADLVIDGKRRKVLMQAPKNGFFYVLDRLTGKLISAEPFVKVTWASRIDRGSGRPVEVPGARYPNRIVVNISPTGVGAHSWMPMAYSPRARLAFIPSIAFASDYTDNGVDLKNWSPPQDRTVSGALGAALGKKGEVTGEARVTNTEISGALVAWDPVAQKARWKITQPTYVNGGLLATGGNLVFQGTIDGRFRAYDAQSGTPLWTFAAQAPIIGTPISYSVKGKQYVTLLTGLGMGITASAGMLGNKVERFGVDPRSQARRVLTFALGGKAELPPRPPQTPLIDDPDFRADPASAVAGGALYGPHCGSCHGLGAVGVTHAPDLRRSAIPHSEEVFAQIVRDGALVSSGMPQFGEFSTSQLGALRQYIRSEADRMRRSRNEGLDLKRKRPKS